MSDSYDLQEMIDDCVKMEQESPTILLVSHGGLIRELFVTIFDELHCEFPPDAQPGDHKRLSKNTSWSRFHFEVANDAEKPAVFESIVCSTLCNADHIKDLLG